MNDGKFSKGQKVRLKEACADIHPQAFAYSEGWVRKSGTDHVGYPLVYIEWDKDQWMYNDQKDGIYPEDHFEGIPKDQEESTTVTQSNEIGDAELLKFMFTALDISKEDAIDAYRSQQQDSGDTTNEVLDAIADCDGFVLITISNESDAVKAEVRSSLGTREERVVAAKASLGAAEKIYGGLYEGGEGIG